MHEQQLIKSLYFGLLQVNFTGSFSLICKSIKYWLKEKQNHPFFQIYMINLLVARMQNAHALINIENYYKLKGPLLINNIIPGYCYHHIGGNVYWNDI